MMECAPDWLATLRRASFRGVPFFVENDAITYGRRVKVHEFPNRDRPFVEDLGEKAIEFKVTAYVASDNVLSEKAALVRACRRGGPGSLVLPSEGSLQVVPYQCERTFSKDKLGLIAFSLSFHEAGTGFGSFTSALLDRLVSVAGETAVSALGAAFANDFNTLGETTWVVDAAIANVSTWLSEVDEVRLEVLSAVSGATTVADQVVGGFTNTTPAGREVAVAAGASAELVGDLAYDVLNAFRDARTLSIGGRGIQQAAGTDLDTYRPPTVSDLPTVAAEIMGAVRLAAPTPTIALDALTRIAEFSPETYGVADVLPTTAAAERQNEQAVGSLFRRLALVEMAIAASGAEYASRRDAIRVRANVAELFERELATADGQVFSLLDEVRGRAAMAISRKLADIRPAVTVEATASAPSLVWAWRLYGDTTREADLAARNRVAHPAFMPATFEAEAPE